MPRHSKYGKEDTQPELLGDQQFVGVNMRLDPSVVPPGYVSEAINCRFNRGVVETRKGFTVPTWANRHNLVTAVSPGSNQTYGQPTGFLGFNFTTATNCVLSGMVSNAGLVVGQQFSVTTNIANPSYTDGALTKTRPDFSGTINDLSVPAQIGLTVDKPSLAGVWNVFNYTTGRWIGVGTAGGSSRTVGVGGAFSWGTIYGMGVFKDPTTLRELLIVATAGGVYYTSPNNIPYPIQLPSGVTLSAPVTFTQAFDKFIMHRGKALTALYISNARTSWSELTQSVLDNPIDGTDTIPNGERSLFFQNRLFIPCRNDEIAVSDFNDISRYVPTLQEFRVNQGSADKLVAITKFNDQTIIAFKEQSVYAINNVYGDLSALQLDQLSDRFGLVSAKTVAQVGNDLWFLTQIGVMSIRQTEQNKLQGVVLPVSEAVQPLIERINWKYASGSVAAYADNKYYLAVPLDNAELLGYEQSPIGLVLVDSIYAIATTPGTLYRVTLPKTSGETTWHGGPSVTQIVVSGTNLVTVTTSTAHGFNSTDVVSLIALSGSPATPTANSLNKTITVTSSTTFTFAGAALANGTFTDKAVAALQSSSVAPTFSRSFSQSKDYLAEGDYIAVLFGGATSAGVSCKTLTQGVNNAVLVYDFLNQAWSGYDQSDGLEPKEFAVLTVNNKKRLLFAGSDGFIKLYEETFDEQLTMPYTEWVYSNSSGHDPLDTVRVNGGTLVGFTGASDNTATLISAIGFSAAVAGKNWSTSPQGNYGFYRGAFLGVYSAPGTFPVPVTNGIRFWSTNGLAPSIIYTAAGTTISYPTGVATIATYTTRPITSSVTTRSYATQNIDPSNAAFVSMDIATWNPTYSVSLLADGENEEFVQVSNRTKDRTKWYRPFDKAPFGLTNSSGLAGDKWRQDYSLLLSNPFGTGTTGEATSFSFNATAGGVNLSQHQQIRETFKTVVKDTGVQVKISNTTGRFKLFTTIVEMRKDQTHVPTVA
jgi:hypothetical protein